jgi:hypothetical protein
MSVINTSLTAVGGSEPASFKTLGVREPNTNSP